VLHEFIALHREELLRRCRAKVASRSVPPQTTVAIDHGVPLFLDQLVEVLRFRGGSTVEMAKTAVLHGRDLLLQGLTVSQVVHGYGDVCQSVTELAMELNAPISTDDFHSLNACLDDAIAGAVTEFGRGRHQSTVEDQAARATERLGFLAHELRNLTHTAILAFEILKTGSVGIGGSTGGVLDRSLKGTRALIDRSLGEVRLAQGLHHRQQFPVSAFIDALAPAAMLEASSRGISLVVMPVDEEVAVEADQQVLAAVIGNLVQNAIKFTRPLTTVTLRVGTTADRVLIEVQDECGGLPEASVTDLFRPFEQRGPDRSGLGLGLAFSRWGVEANDGRLYARSLPGTGCVFTVDLPRHRTEAVEIA
jgi:signal transduction histidine kinase